MSSMQSTVAPIHKTLDVRCEPAVAFQVFTREIGSWWPLATHSIGGDEIVEMVFEEHVDGRVFERHSDGGEGEWGRVLQWDPPHRFVMTWHPGAEPTEATELEVRFSPGEAGTRVELIHRGWENRGTQAAAARGSYESGWDAVLGHYTEVVG